MQKKIYERKLLGGRGIIGIYVTESKNENIFEVEAFGKTYTFENIYDSDVFKLIRLFEYNTYADAIDMVNIINKNCRHLKLKWDCGELVYIGK